MKHIIIYIPFLISLLSGMLLVSICTRKNQDMSFFMKTFLAAGIGLGLSAQITYLSFLFLNQLNLFFIMLFHAGMLFTLFIIKLLLKNDSLSEFPIKNISFALLSGTLLVVLFLFIYPLWQYAKFYPHGGWDAWQVWNFKAKFLHLSGDTWTNLFKPMMWRTSPHYPLLLPLINVWGWAMSNQPVSVIPLTTSIIFTILTAGLLFLGLLQNTKSYFSTFAPLTFLTLPFYNIIATSQYCDIVLSFYLFASLLCLHSFLLSNQPSYTALAGFFIGFLSFTKPEGSIAAGILFLLGGSAIFLHSKNKAWPQKRSPLLVFCLAVLATAALTVAFQLVHSPGNQTYVNGLFSSEKPVTFLRLNIIFSFLWRELANPHWNKIWGLLGVGIILSKGRCFLGKRAIFPLFIFIYMFIVTAYYIINTNFEIIWWLNVTLFRIYFSLLPVFTYWIFESLLSRHK